MTHFPGTSGADTLTGGANSDLIEGLGGADRLVGGLGADQLFGGDGDDMLIGNLGDLVIDGGAGVDAADLDFRAATGGMNLSVADAIAGVTVAGAQISGVERLIVRSGSGADVLTGGSRADSLDAGAGDDIVNGGQGDTLLAGGLGIDLGRLDFSGATGSLNFTVATNLTAAQTISGAQVSGFERVEFVGGVAGDRLTGGSLSDLLDGRAGNDWLKGEGGDDRLLGGDGYDILDGGAGNDTLDGGAQWSDQMTGGDGADLLIVDAGDAMADGGAGRDHGLLDFSIVGSPINFSVAANLAGNVKVDVTTIKGLESVDFSAGSRADSIAGGAYFDTLRGNDGDDQLAGEGGGDSLAGGQGGDTLTGGSGDDTLDGGVGFDAARFSGKASDYQATLMSDGDVSITDLRAGGDGMDLIRGVEQFAFTDRTLSLAELVTGNSNHAPVLANDAATTTEDTGVGITVLANDSDPDVGDTLKVVSVDTTGVQGAVAIGSQGAILYTPTLALQALNAGETLVEHFTYTVADLQGATATAGVSVSVVGANDAPTLQNDMINIGEQGGATINVLANDFDVDAGDQLTLLSATAGLRGSTKITAEGAVVYTPGSAAQSLTEGQTLTDSFTYTVRDKLGATSSATVSVAIHGENDAPVAADDSFTVAKSGATVLGDVLANDDDIDQGDHIVLGSVQSVSAQGASISVDAQGRIAYDPGDLFADLGAGQTASDSFTYQVIDSHGAASTATVALTVSGSAVPEPALLQEVQVEEDASSMNLYQDILDGAATVLGEEVNFVSVDTVGTLGTVSLGADSLVYTADDPILDGLWGDDHLNTQFLYTVRTADGDLHTGAVDVRVTGLGDVPEASPDSFGVGEGGSTGNLWNTLLANDFDADEGQEVDIATVSTVGTVGRVSLDTAGNSLVYHADTAAIMALNPGETLTDHFTYTLKGAYGAPESTTTVTVTVTGEGMTMVAMDQSDTVPAHSADAFSAPLSWGGSSGAEAGWALL